MSVNKNLMQARAAKQDEFYTQLRDIEEEMQHYREHFKGKTILCNCDDPRESNFFKFFANSFEFLGLKKLITTCYSADGKAFWLEYNGDKNGNRVPDPEEIGVHPLKGDGDFRSPECIEFLKQADIVVTNPPFSLFREYIAQLMEYGKKFIILGNMNAVTYKEVFPLFMDGKVWYGPGACNGSLWFGIPDHYVVRTTNHKVDSAGNHFVKVDGIRWFTNLDYKKRHEELILVKRYKKNPELFPKYDNYNAINVDGYKDIPMDYYGVMGVPISFMDHYCPEQFELIGLDRYVADNPNYGHRFWLNGREKYARILIRRKK